MKKILILVITITSLSAFSQKYRTASDTVALNKEYLRVSNDIAELSSKLTVAQNNLPGYQNKAVKAASDAQSTAMASSNQASNAVNGSVKDARKEKRRAKNALKEAKGARTAENKEKHQDKKIASLKSELEKKQERLKELDNMRSAINGMQQ